jgi:SAM-dependent methyltransferase
MSSYSRQQMENWLKTIDINVDRVLDIGGAQLPIASRVKSWSVKDYKILDLNVPHETKRKPDFELDIQDDNALATFVQNGIGTFDVAFCLEVAEYWYDPLRALKNIGSLLKTGGTLYLSTHFVYPVHSPSGLDYLRYTRHGILQLLERSGFNVEEIRGREWESINWQSVYISEKMRPDKTFKYHEEVGNLIKCIKR